MSSSLPRRQAYAEVPGGRVWYEVVGDGPGIPLVTLHGGPGMPHDYLEPLAHLGVDRPVVFYDQLGCGRSPASDDPALWRVERFVSELAALVGYLGFDRLHLLGHSWGTMLALEYTLAWPVKVASLVLASPAISIPRWLADLAEYRRDLPAPVREALDRHEAAGTTDSPGYQAATARFYQHHVCRLFPWPLALRRAAAGAGEAVYRSMWGENEFLMTGSLRDYDGTASLRDVRVPTLYVCGRYDEGTPGACAEYARQTPRAEVIVLERSSHMAMLEEEAEFRRAVAEFLGRAERSSR